MVAVADEAVHVAQVLFVGLDGLHHGQEDLPAGGVLHGGAGDGADLLCGLLLHRGDRGSGGSLGHCSGLGGGGSLRGQVALLHAHGVHVHVHQLFQLVVQLHEGQGGAHHVQRGEVVAHIGAVDLDAHAGQDLLDLGEEHVELHDGGGAQAGHQAGHLVAGLEGIVGDYHVHHPLGHLGRGLQGADLDTGLAVVADAHLHGAVLDLKVGGAHGGQGAGGQADAHAAAVVDGLLGGGDDLVQRRALGGLGAAALPHEDLAGHAAALLPLVLGRRGHVVVGHHGLHREALLLRHLGGHLHVHVVAGVIAVEAGHPRAAVGRPEGLQEGQRGGRGADLAHGRGVAHVLAHVADEGGLVAGAAAGDHADLAGPGGVHGGDDASGVVLAGDDVLDDIAVAFDKACQHLVNDVIGVI